MTEGGGGCVTFYPQPAPAFLPQLGHKDPIYQALQPGYGDPTAPICSEAASPQISLGL